MDMAEVLHGDNDSEAVEEAFGELAVERGLVSREQLEGCVGIRKHMLAEGKHTRLGEIMIARHIITKAQGLELLKAAHQKLGHKQRIGGYELLDKLGEGAMGTVYRANQLSMDRPVALKLLPRALSRNPGAIERFLREARTVARLNHPNIVRGFEVAEGNGFYYFAMEFVNGGTIEDRLARDKVMPEEEVIDIGIQTAEALFHAHEHDVIHRDVKPGNIMCVEGGVVKLADLGLATGTGDEGLTNTGDTIGTPYYMSPEQAAGEAHIDGRSDIYALGATLYHMVTGKVPFDGPNAPAIISKRLGEDPPPACSINGRVSRELTAIIMKMMARKPRDRYADCMALIEDLRLVQDGDQPECYHLASSAEIGSKVRDPSRTTDGLRRFLTRPRWRGPALPPWLTPRRVSLALAASFLLVGVTVFVLWHEKFLGPVHPHNPAISWSSPPQIEANHTGEDIRREWISLRDLLYDQDAPASDQLEALEKFIVRYPESAYGRRARRILVELRKQSGDI